MSEPTQPAQQVADSFAQMPPAERRKAFFAVFPSIMLPMFMNSVDQTIVATALPAIAADLGEVDRVSLVVVVYLLSTTIVAPAYGRLGDVLGRKRMLIVALSLSALGSLLCALATSMPMLLATRILQGLGGGGLMTMSQSLIGEAIPARERGRYQGYLAATFVTSSTFGPVAGGFLTQHFGWFSVFLVTFIVGLCAIALAQRLPGRRPKGGRVAFDFWGMVLFAGFVAPLLLALQSVHQFHVAILPRIALLLALAIVSLILLLRQERRATAPLLPLNLLRQPGIWRTCAMAASIAGAMISMVSFLPMYLQVVRGISPAEVGFVMLPMTVGVGFGAMVTGRLISATGRTTLFPRIGLPVTVAGYLFLAWQAPELSIAQLPWVFALVSLFTGSGMPVVQMTVQSVAGPQFLGAAAASVQLSRAVGAAFGTALVGAVLFASLAVQDATLADQFAELVQRGHTILATLDPARQVQMRQEIANAFAAAFTTMALLVLTAIGLAWWIPVQRI